MTSSDKPQIDHNQPAVSKRLLAAIPSWMISTIFHMIVLIVLAIYTLPSEDLEAVRQLLLSSQDVQEETVDDFEEEIIEELNIEVATDAIEVASDTSVNEADISPIEEVAPATTSVELSEIGIEHAPSSDLLSQVGEITGNSLSGRSENARKGMVIRGGGTKGSEKAVSDALQWLARHQFPDGGWSFNHARCPQCHGQCRNPGAMTDSRAAATGLALLPFLGAGQTHQTGKYQKTVQAGLNFLKSRIKLSRNGGSLHEAGGRMYSHGIASIALCEAYAMTQDKTLLPAAQSTLNFIGYAQDPIGGGWRYDPRTPGDTSVAGWQVMALKSGHMGYLAVPQTVLRRAYAFLDAVQFDGGARYGYVNSTGGSAATTAVGLLCRMYFGWKKGNTALERGIGWISRLGPTDDLYYNYYATQVMRHWGGEPWDKWNAVMRDRLVESQSKTGHEAGSWYMPDSKHVTSGGRLYCTALATMILEVYYRHLPIFAKQSTTTEFPID